MHARTRVHVHVVTARGCELWMRQVATDSNLDHTPQKDGSSAGAGDCGVLLGLLEPLLCGDESCRRCARRRGRQQRPRAAAWATVFVGRGLCCRRRVSLVATELLAHGEPFLAGQVEPLDAWVGVREVELEPQRHLAGAVPSGDVHGADQRDRDQQGNDEQCSDAIVTSRPAHHRE